MDVERSEDKGRGGEHEAGEGDEVQAGQGPGQPLVIAGEPAEAHGPGKAAFHGPPAEQEGKPPLRLGMFEDLQPDAVCLGRLGPLLPGGALVHIRQLHRLAGRVLDCTGDLCPS